MAKRPLSISSKNQAQRIMKTAKEIIHSLREQDIRLNLKDEAIEVVSLKDKLTPDQIDVIRSHKETLIAYLKTIGTNGGSKPIPIVKTALSYALSDAQRRLWLVCQFKEASGAYNLPFSVTLDGLFDFDSFTRAIGEVIDRHEILRTVFKEDESGEVRQWILDSKEIGFSIDVKDFSKNKNPKEASDAYIKEDSYAIFDLENGPLIRASLHQLSAEEHVFYYNMHHIISDGWSIEVLGNDVMTLYNAYKNGQDPQLSPLRIQYKDYAHWKLSQENDEAYEKDKQYWIQKLSGELPLLDLPGQKVRPKFKSTKGGSVQTFLSEELTKQLNVFVQKHKGSLFTGLLAALNVMFYRYTGKKDIIIGSPMVGRDHPDLQDQIGFYINNLPFRNNIDPSVSFTAFYEGVTQQTLESFEHTSYPFDRLVEDLEIQYDMSRTPVYDVSLTLHDSIEQQHVMPVNLSIEDMGETVCKNDIEFHFRQMGSVISFNIRYNSDLYAIDQFTSFMAHFKQLLAAMLTKPDISMGSINYLNKEEREGLLHFSEGAVLEYAQDATLLSLFQEQVDAVPNKDAIVYEDQKYSYQGLDEISNQLANCLIQDHGISEGNRIGIQLDRSEFAIIAMMGILKTGSAYVPIDPAYPAERKKHIIDDSGIQLLLTSTNYMFDSDYFEGAIFALDVEFEASEYPHKQPDISVTPNESAYVIYTSGSTGVPKGVEVPHKGIVNTAQAMIDMLDLKSCEQSLQFASFSFDASAFEIFNGLLSGSTLHIVSEEKRKNPAVLEAYIEDQKIETATLPPSFLKMMDMNAFKTMKVLVTAGESPVWEKVKDYLLHGGTYFNAYGPTETSVCSSVYKMTELLDTDSKVIPMGIPICNVQTYILNNFNDLQPEGVLGEICIGGAGLAKGYLNRPELTAERFIEHPFKKGERLYKTGDVGRWLPGGFIEFIGRIDDQVKIRGHRIELGEIAHQLESKPEITETKLLVRETANGEKELVAYLVSEVEEKASNLKLFLAGKLPDYMLPAHFIQLDEIPLTVNGKVDTAKLLSMGGVSLSSEVAYVAPRTKSEEKLVEIWKRLLNLDTIGVADDFFLLGGQSLKAMSLINEYQKSFDVKLTLKDLFENSTLEAQDALIRASDKNDFINIVPIEKSDDYPISDSQRRLWVLSQFEGGSVAYNIPVWSSITIEDLVSFKKAVALVIERHEILRTVFRKNDQGEIRQFILNAEALNFEVDLQDFREHEQPQQAINDYVRQDSYRLFDLETGPLLRASLLRISENEYVFYYNMHHIISDGWSMEVLTKDVMTHYEANLSGVAVALTPLRIQYKDYASWQLTQQENTDYLAHREYWLSHLSGDIPLLDLPSQQVRPKVKTYNGGSLRTQLPKDAVHLSRAFVEAQGGSLFMLLLSALKVLLYGYTGETDIVIGTPVSGRNHFDLEDQIGFYINTLALRNQLSPEDDFTSFYQQLKENTLTSFDHQMYPFDRLTEDLNHRSSAGRSPLFDILIDMAVSEIAGSIDATYEIADSGDILTKYDLEFHFTDVNNELVFQINYNKNIYDHKMVEGLMKHFERLLSKLMAAPESEISSINYLSDAEENELLHTLNQTELAYSNETVIELFEAQAASNPDDIALVSETESLSYAELNQQANSFAHCLKTEHGIGVGDLVGVKLERDHWLLVAILGILKAGAGYVPIEPGMAASREGYMLQDSGVGLVITGSDFMLDFTEDYQGNIFTIDIEFDASQYPSTALSDIQANPTDLAYVIYTSGSTGTPKGTLIEHRSLTNYLLWCSDYYLNRDKEVSNFGLFTSISFDLTVTSLFLPLLNGGRLHIMPRKLDVSTTLRDYITSGISGIKLTPAHIMLMEDLGIEQSSLQLAIVGGDVLHPRHVEILRRINPQIRIYNEYGPTEATVGCIVSEVKDPEAISIGTPIANTQVYLLDAHGKLPPKGVVGEICIGGAGLARGYLGLDQLTKQKFIAHPFSPGARLYRTGDMGRWLKDGSLSFIGRGDDQVKVRGHRIELGEIEHRIREHSDIKEAALLVSELSEGDKELVAYIVADQLQEVSVLRRFLGEGLPDYMIPSRYIQVEEMPLTVNGKIDRKALLQTEGQVLSNGSDYVAPRNEIEEKLIVILSEELKFDADKIGVNDNFFDLGMNSLKLIKILEQFNREFNLEIKPISMFEYTTVNDFISNVFDDQQAIKEEDNSFESSEDLSQEIDDFITSMNE